MRRSDYIAGCDIWLFSSRDVLAKQWRHPAQRRCQPQSRKILRHAVYSVCPFSIYRHLFPASARPGTRRRTLNPVWIHRMFRRPHSGAPPHQPPRIAHHRSITQYRHHGHGHTRRICAIAFRYPDVLRLAHRRRRRIRHADSLIVAQTHVIFVADAMAAPYARPPGLWLCHTPGQFTLEMLDAIC